MKSGIYKITSPSGKIYIGQSRNIAKRKYAYRCLDCKQQHKIYNSILKYGWSAHIFEVLEYCEIEFLNEREIFYIKHFDSVNSGLNIQAGGFNTNWTESMRANYKKNRIYIPLTEVQKENLRIINTGKKYSQETKNKLSELRMGNSYALGYKHNEQTKAKMSKAKSGVIFTENRKKNISKSLIGKKRLYVSALKSKKVIDLSTGIVYNSITNASEIFGINRKTLSNMLTGFRKNKTSLIYKND